MKLVETKINNMLLLDPGKLFFFVCVSFLFPFFGGGTILYLIRGCCRCPLVAGGLTSTRARTTLSDLTGK